MKDILFKLILTALAGFVCLVGYAQIKVGDPVFLENFGIVPENWASYDNRSDKSNIQTYRQPIGRGTIHNHGFAATKWHDPVKIGSWVLKEGYWETNVMQDIIGGDGTYAVACNGDYLGNADTWHGGVNHTLLNDGEIGMALVVNAKNAANTLVYDNTITGLDPLYTYQFNFWAANAEQGSLLATLPGLKIELTDGYQTFAGETGELPGQSSGIIWKESKLWGFVSPGRNELKYSITSKFKGAAGNIFTLDDISLCPLLVKADRVNIDFCRQPGMVWFEAVIPGLPDGLKVYLHLMRTSKGQNNWEWDPGNPYIDSLKFSVPEEEYGKYDYRLVIGLNEYSVTNLPDNPDLLNEYGAYSITENFVPVYSASEWGNFELGLKFCEDPVLAVFKGDKDALPVAVPLYTRLMQRQRGSEGEWTWRNEVSDSLDVRAGAIDYLTCEYQVAMEVVVPDLLNRETPQAFMESDNHGCFTVKNVFRNDFCRELFGVDIQYTQVVDSVVVVPQMVVNDGEQVYLRWLYRPWDVEAWDWWGESRPLEENKVDWVTFASGDFRCVYAMNPDLLNAMQASRVGTRDYYYVATEENTIAGIPLKINIKKNFVGGGVVLKAEPDMPSKVVDAVKGYWMVREKGTGNWTKMEGFEQRVGVPDYVAHEYLFVASMSQGVMDTLDINRLVKGHLAYWLSDTVYGETVELNAITRNYCEEPGNVLLKANFTSSGIPSDMPEIGRWRMRVKGGDEWTWNSNYSGIRDLSVPMEDFLTHEYQLVVAWDADSLDNWQKAGLPVKPGYYLLEERFEDALLCMAIDTIRVNSIGRDLLELSPQLAKSADNLTVYGKWMRKAKGTDAWEWVGEADDRKYGLEVNTKDFGKYDFCFNASLARRVFDTEPVDLKEKPYVVAKELIGIVIAKPGLLSPVLQCIAKQDSNRVTVVLENPEQISSLVYRFGNGEAVKVAAQPHQEFHFTIDRDSVFHLLSYSQEGVCDSIIRNDEIALSYIPKLKITRFTDVFGCRHTVNVIEPFVVGASDVNYQWYQDGQLLADQRGDSLRVVFEETGHMPLKLKVDGNGVCPEDSTVYLITGEYPEITFKEQAAPKELCVGQAFSIGYDKIEAEQYRVSLKSTTMSDFIYYPGTGKVEAAENGELEIRSLQAPLTATEFMVGSEFTFRVQIFRTAEYRGINYRCEDEFEYRFRVRPTVESRYPSIMKLCEQSEITINPEVEANGNQVGRYRWRLWDGVSLQEQELISSETDMTLRATVAKDWNNKRLQLTALCECGEVVVQDMNLSVFIPDSNWIVGPDKTVLSGDKIILNGSEVQLRDMEYRWETRSGNEEWQRLAAEKKNNMSFYAPDTTTEYRRSVIGEGWDCPGMAAGPILLKVYNNEVENRIYLADRDTLVSSGTFITIHSDALERDDIQLSWEKYEDGSWEEIAGENKPELNYNPGTVSKFRRIARVGEERLYSNEVIVNVYDSEHNRILLTAGVLAPGEKVKILGNYVNISGVRYSWYENLGEGWKRLESQQGYNLEKVIDKSTKFVRYVYLPSQDGDSLRSNEVVAYVFDNATDNRIGCDRLNVCGGEMVTVHGQVFAGEGVAYRWEYSADEGNTWVVLNDATGSDYTFVAEKNICLRRGIIYTETKEAYSNVLAFNVIHNSSDNQIAQDGIGLLGQNMVISGSEVNNASYQWEKSLDGESGWEEISGAVGQNLNLEGKDVLAEYFVRRRLLFSEEAGCEGVSNVLKLKVFDQEKGNVVRGPESPVCQWSEFTLIGSDMGHLNAGYRWFSKQGDNWLPVDLAIGKDLTVYEGCGQAAQFYREAVIGDIKSNSNVIEVQLWDDLAIDNTLKQPGIACAGQDVTIVGADALGSGMDLSGYIKSYAWEVSTTGAGSTWKPVDTVHTKDLFLKDVVESRWYCRVVKTYCGSDLRSTPVFLDVREKLRFTLRNDAPFGSLNPKEPITISIDEDDFESYELKIDGQTVADGQQYLFYGWLPKRDYQIVAHVVSPTGCSQVDTMRMRTPDVDLPNVLTPNDDGYNDVLLQNYELKVYNRWGNLLYNGHEGWDGRYKGKLVSAGTYFYVVKINHVNGVATEYKKSVTVKRE